MPIRSFTCGSRPGAAEINEYLHAQAIVDQVSGLSQVWVAVDPQARNASEYMAGFFTLSPLSIKISPALIATLSLPSSVAYPQIGGYLLGRLGVASYQQGQDYGSALVAAAIKLARHARHEATGGAFLAVDSKNDRIAEWYETLGFGFCRLDPTKRRIVLKL